LRQLIPDFLRTIQAVHKKNRARLGVLGEVKAQAIAKILGCDAVKPGQYSSDHLLFDWGGELFLPEFKERIHISTSFPSANGNYWGPSPNPHKITLAATKNPEQIAKDIQTRLLGDYKAAYLDAFRRMNEYEANEASKAALAKRLADIVGGEISRNDPTKFYILHSFNPIGLEGHILGEDVELKITCSPEMAERICGEIGK
jgi:hypothetical protein